jgi:energy-coupling factor transporter ATP-binding protein EcfA2
VTAFTFTKAVKAQEKLRLALDGPPGGGKTYTALVFATTLAAKSGGRIALIDSERSSARKYAGMFDFDHLTLPDNDPRTYIDAIKAAAEAGYAVLIVDSLSHAWEGTLDMKDRVQKRSKSNDGFGAWREVTPVHNELVDVMLRFPGHVIATMRTKMEYLVEHDESRGKNVVSKVGLKPVQRDGVDYEFDVVADMDQENTMTVTKSRCFDLAGAVIRKPGADVALSLWEWLQDGEPLVTADQAEQIRAVFKGVTDDQERVKCQRIFAASFGKPAEVTASQFDQALAFAREVIGADTATDPDAGFDEAPVNQSAPGEVVEPSTANEAPTTPAATADPTDGTGADAPTPSSTDAGAVPLGAETPENLQMDLEMAIKGLPSARQPACRDELRKTFGDLSSATAEELTGALDIVKNWPIEIHSPNAASLPGATEPPLNTKQRQLVAYARGIGVDESQLRALAAMHRGSTEPRPLSELDDGACLAMQGLLARVELGEIVFDTGNSGLIAKEKVGVQ